MSTYTTLVILCGLVIFSYLFDLFAKRTRFPSVVLLMLLGIGISLITEYLGVDVGDTTKLLAVLGNVGLILIVLEGALEIHFDKGKLGMLKRAFLSALFVLLGTAALIAVVLKLLSSEGWYVCVLNALPFAVISSSIAIPSVAHMRKKDREFVIYESSLSDIIGIVVFDFVLFNDTVTSKSILGLGLDMGAIALISVVFCLGLLFIMGKLKHHIKFFLIMSVLVMVYALAKQFHLSSLIIVLAFGLLLNNADRLNHPVFARIFHYPKMAADLDQMKTLTAESAFLIRTFFFLLFGFSINLPELGQLPVLALGAFMIAAIYFARIGIMALVAKEERPHVQLIAPRGLISILLFFSIPAMHAHPLVGNGVLFVVILCSSLLMSYALLRAKKEEPEAVA
ncbi:MAG: cation:proton antiporter [Flavobacteriales bacterium]|jgi:NhaP-type Na+/H+ or K+/H+ antiporter|nr:cation:proton antiporter [Flavobacteriales bacterium]MBP9160532.1 cation:proton antiporter [Flavobacteriales bacterium]MCI1753562.1 cation:proton antiporter [Flavobacteriales bacterium]